MTDLYNATWIELRKALRSKVPLFTTLGFLMLPLAMGFLMFVYQHPVFAREFGLVSAKANLAGGSADWPFYLNMYAQGIAIGGILLFSLIFSWVFGREFSDGTLKDLLAVPVRRITILAGKFILTGLWCLLLALFVYAVGLLIGALLGLPQGSPGLFLRGSVTLLTTTVLVILVSAPAAFFASVGRGYLFPVGISLLLLLLANIIALIGWGDYFPWSVPALYAGMAGQSRLPAASYVLVFLAGAGGIAATGLWWNYADQSR